MVVRSQIQVLGKIWWPYGAVCAMTYSPQPDDVRDPDTGEITRASVDDWLSRHAGDFSEILDFTADIADGDKDIVIPWADEENEMTYADCMWGDAD
jgi:hypothetical protein